ncbi:MAG: carbohydrate kinase family protein [Firmicutes bacterium]|nr:carbohydrate kinase family protein [Bacillota bacterium]
MAKITVVGGINIDIEGSPFEKLKYHDSNPGRINLAFGGVGRNIAENAARLGGDVAMVSVIGDDQMGKAAKMELEDLGVDTSCIRTLQGRNSAMYLSILDDRKDMELALCDMDIIEAITPAFLEDYRDFIAGSGIIALDGNLSEELLCCCVEMFRGIPVFFDPVSSAKAVKARNCLGGFDSIKPNIIEAEILTGITIDGDEDVRRAADRLLEKGVKRVFITLNRDGVYYRDSESEGFIRPADNLKIVSATGAGDSFSATILLGSVQQRKTDEIARMGMAAASIAMESGGAVNREMNLKELLRRINKNV